MRAMAELGAAMLALSVVSTTACGTRATSSSYGTNTGSQSTSLTITCTPVSGQQMAEPYFIGQNLKCRARNATGPADVRWSATSGAISDQGVVTNVTEPGILTVSAVLATSSTETSGHNTSSQNLNVSFAKPVGAPGLIFSIPLAAGSAMWDFVIDDSNQIYGAGWKSRSTPNAELFSMDFWERQPRTAEASKPSLLTAAVLMNGYPLFGGGGIDTSSYRPLLISSDSTPTLLTSVDCPGSGLLTALAFDSARGVGWAAWSGDNGAARIRIDQQNFRLECSASNQLVSSTSAQIKVPWIWSIHATNTGTVAAGHYLSENDTIGFVNLNNEDGTEIRAQEFRGLADIRVTPPIYDHELPFFYMAGHDTTNGDDVWTVKKLDARLQPLWTKQWSITQSDTEPLSIITDPNGGVILGGKATQLAPAGGDTKLTDAVLMSLDNSGELRWGPMRINPSSTGTEACVASSIRLTPNSKFLLASVNCGQSTINSYVLGFALP